MVDTIQTSPAIPGNSSGMNQDGEVTELQIEPNGYHKLRLTILLLCVSWAMWPRNSKTLAITRLAGESEIVQMCHT